MAKTNAHKYPTCTRNLNNNQTNSKRISWSDSKRHKIISEQHKNQLNDQRHRIEQL